MNISNLEWVSHKENMIHLNSHKKWSNNAKSGAENSRSIPIIQFDKSGNKIKEWVNISEASKALTIGGGDITMACQKKRKSAGGFQWSYAHINSSIGKLEYNRKSVVKLTTNGDFIEQYDNVYIASKITNLSHSGIWNCCNGKYKTCGGFIWSYSHNLISKIQSPLSQISL